MSIKTFLSRNHRLGARALNALLLSIVVLAAGLGAGFLLGRRSAEEAGKHHHAPGMEPAGPAALKTLYTCGMCPEIIADKPGDCPKCHMRLTPMEPDRARIILEARGEIPAEAAPGLKTLYTCGMHPEVISDEPGDCPKCHMRLTPMEPDRARMILEARGEMVPQGGSMAQDRKILYWRAPMDPAYIRNAPGKSPMGMDLVPVYADEVAGGPSIRIDPVTEQNMGVRYDVVRVGPLERTVRTVGTIAYDEQSLGTVSTKMDGWVEKVYVNETGAQVHAGDALFEFYSPQLYSAQEELLVALRDAANDATRALAGLRVESARDRLRFFDVSEAQIEELTREKRIRKTLTITARLTGIVTERNLTEGEMLKAGEPAYRMADLSNVWVIGKVYPSDLPYIRLGQEAVMRLEYLPGKVYRGRITYIYPYLAPGTREVPVRMEFHNPGYELKPGMFATLQIQSRVAERAVLVPTTAVIDTGERKVAFVAPEPGRFEPRRVETGLRSSSGEWQVLGGLAPGEWVVVSGQFLLDSESRLREATLKMLRAGMVNTTDQTAAPTAPEAWAHPISREADAGGLHYVCPMPSHAWDAHDQPGHCPRCGMRMVPASPAYQFGTGKIAHYTCPMPEHYSVQEETGGKCPLCGMTLIPVTEEDLERLRQADEQAAPRALYTCPMASHAHIVSDEAGACPECNMKLVPTESVAHGAQAEARWREDHPGADASKDAPTLYTCPMASHAHIVSDKPERCGECNMTLVPTASVAHGAQAEARWREDHPDADASKDAPTLYTCPMASHAHIVSDKPERCGECNMMLVPTASVAHGAQAEARWRKDHPGR